MRTSICHPHRFLRVLCAMFGVALLSGVPATASSTPEVRVENIRRAFHNGEHNAFTDLIRWQGRFWLAFRSCPDGHGVHATSSIIVLTSTDAQSWQQAHRFSVPERDTRDPHFLIFRDQLFVYSGTWYPGKDRQQASDWNAHLGYAVWTRDGRSWEGPRALEGTYGHYIWRAVAQGDRAYLGGRRWREHRSGKGRERMENVLLQSDDGLRWQFVSRVQESDGNETAFVIERDGTMVGVCRADRETAVLARARPPYTEWKRETLAGYIGGPMLARWNDRYIVGGRRLTPEGPQTTLMWLEGTKLTPFAALPSGGDNSYPGFFELDDGRGLVSWYSTHEKDADGKPITAIYLAELALTRR